MRLFQHLGRHRSTCYTAIVRTDEDEPFALHINGIAYCVLYVEGQWLIGPMYTNDEADYPDYGPFEQMEQAVMALKLTSA